MKFDLGGTTRGGEYQTVNLVGNPDVRADILDVDAYAPEEGSIDEFRLSHTLEHVPSGDYVEFLMTLRRKLRVGGCLRVIQSDGGAVIDQYARGELSFRSMRTVIFPPADRLRANPLNHHFNMWSENELRRDLEALGFETTGFDAGSWPLDTEDELAPVEVERDRGKPIRNLGVLGKKVGIPRLIHQTWKTDDVPADIFPPEWIATWQELDGFEYRLWTDADNRELIAQHYPWFLSVYDGYDCEIKRVDAARYFILHRHGGIYADLDFILLRPLDPLLEGNDLLLGYQLPGSVCNALMGCSPGHPLMDSAIAGLAETADRYVLDATGPRFLSSVVERSYHLPEIIPAEILYPYAWNSPLRDRFRGMDLDQLRREFPLAVTITHWLGTWLDSTPEIR